MKQYLNHFTFALRVMGKTPMISVLSILVLAVSIALSTVMFNVTDGVLMSKLPFRDSERLMAVERVNPVNSYANPSIPFASFHKLIEQQRMFDGLIGTFGDSVNLQHGLKVGQVDGVYISPQVFDLLGIQPILGRALTEDDARAEAPPVMVISYKVWNDFFAASTGIIGKSVMADGISRTIIGVAPEDFDYPFVNQLWLPLNTDTLVESTGWGSTVYVTGMLSKGVTREAALTHLNEIFTRIKSELPVENEGYESLRILPFKELFINNQLRAMFIAMGICAALVLFMGCAIVSNLVTVRSVKRSNELAIRSALGAARHQIVLQMLFESLITAVMALTIGWMLMHWFTTSVMGYYYSQFRVPAWFFGDGYNLRHYVFVIVVLFVVTIVSTLIPALRASRTNINDLLKESTRTGTSLKITLLGRALIIFQIAAACAVITGGGIVGYFLHKVMLDESEFNPDQYLYASVGMDNNTHRDTHTRINLLKSLKRSMEAHPEVLSFTYSTQFYTGSLISALRNPEVQYASADAYPQFQRWVVAPGFLDAMNYQLLAGRDFSESDDADHPYVVILTDIVARELFGNENPLGKQVIYSGEEERTATVIGVVGDIFRAHLERNQRSGFLMCAYQEVWMDFGLHIQTTGNPRNVESALVSALAAIDPVATINEVATIRERYDRNLVGLRFIFVLFLTFSVGALLMAGAGLYGVVSFSVSQQIKDIGIRLALGASPAHIVLRVFRHGLLNVGIGIVIGILIAFLLRYLLAFVLSPLQESMAVYAAILLSILLLSSIAILIPAIQGGTTDPADALRVD